MMRRATLPAIFLLAAIAVATAHADTPHRGRDHDEGARWGSRQSGQAYGEPRGYGERGGRGRDYSQPPPTPYEPPLAPRFYQGRPNSLGGEWAAGQQDEARMGVRQGRIMPLARVVQNLERLRPGRVLDAGLEAGPDGRAAYRVRWAAKGGQRIDFIIDAETGAVIGRGSE